MLQRVFILFFALSSLSVSNADFTLATFFTSHMVLQEAPDSANLFGTYSDGPVFVGVECLSGLTRQYEANLNEKEMTWTVSLDPISSGEKCKIELENNLDLIVLEDILFGDVWFCSGQSNMGWSMLGIDNKTDEIEASQNYTNIRMFRVGQIPSGQPENDLIFLRDYWDEWVDPTTDGWKYGKYLLDFSAICFLFARGMSDHLGNKPLGLIASSYAGTRIEAWSPPETLDTCGIEDYIDVNHDYNSNSHLYNSMVHPFHKMSIKGAVWYQGEANSFWNPDKYQCMLKNMLGDWRNRWSQNSGTNFNFPVGLVQLGPLANPPEEKETRNNDGSLFPLIRWHQTMDQGFLPNSEEQNGFSAVSFDTYYNGTVHPHNKQLPAQRLAIAGLSIAYGLPNFPSKGPFPMNFEIIEIETGGVIVQIEYDEDPISYLPVENSGFFFCCGLNSFSSCMGDQVVPATNWKLVSKEDVEQTGSKMITITLPNCYGPSSLGYLWAESPVTVTHGLPIYSTNNYELPAAPWWKKL